MSDDEITRIIGWWISYLILMAMTAVPTFRIVRKHGMSANWRLLALVPIWGAVIVYAVAVARKHRPAPMLVLFREAATDKEAIR
jgi:hypothetical protein